MRGLSTAKREGIHSQHDHVDGKTIMANVVQGPSLLVTSLHRSEPTLMIVPGLRSLPFWTSAGQVAYQDPQISKIVHHLQQNVAAIREEYIIMSPSLPSDYDVTTKSKTDASSLSYAAPVGTEHATAAGCSTSSSLHTGSWDWHSYLLHGQVQSKFCEQFPITTKIVQDIGPDLFTHNPFGFCFFSKLSGNSSIQAHASPINFRLRIHLPLIVPSSSSYSSSSSSPPPSSAVSSGNDPNDTATIMEYKDIGIRVGPVVQTWHEGHAMVLDDSYNHQVWNNTQAERIILLVDVWHPDVRPREREEIVRMFHHAKQQGWLSNK